MWKLVLTVLCLSHFASAEISASDGTHKNQTNRQKATAVLRNANQTVVGIVHLEETDDGILITGNISGLTPGAHGFHVHEKGDVSDPKCMSAGGHFNPFNHTHGKPDDDQRHVGDLGNIEAALGQNDTTFTIIDKVISFKGDTNILGRTLVVHADKDDYGRGTFNDSSTTGHAGARIACGIIEKNNAVAVHSSILLGLLPLFLILAIRH